MNEWVIIITYRNKYTKRITKGKTITFSLKISNGSELISPDTTSILAYRRIKKMNKK